MQNKNIHTVWEQTIQIVGVIMFHQKNSFLKMYLWNFGKSIQREKFDSEVKNIQAQILYIN